MSIFAKAYLFDLNGTMIDDMQYHTIAWHGILTEDLGAKLTLEEVKVQMYGKNSELLDRVFGKGYFAVEKALEISLEKERRYQEAFRPELKLIDGLDRFLEEAKRQNIRMAIGSAAIPFNIDFVLDNLNLRKYFGAIVSADDVVASKPDSETFLKGSELLGISPEKCLVFEDAPKGIEAAQNAGMDALCITTLHPKEDFEKYNNIVKFISNYSSLELL